MNWLFDLLSFCCIINMMINFGNKKKVSVHSRRHSLVIHPLESGVDLIIKDSYNEKVIKGYEG